jgi:dolichol kinase
MLQGFISMLLYFIIAASSAFILRFLINFPHEVFRKLLHGILICSFIVFMECFPTWQSAALASIIFMLAVWPILKYFERYKQYSSLTTERSKGELKQSLLIVFSMFAMVITISKGIFQLPQLGYASIFAWGLGDACAALIGKKYGKHKIKGKYLDGKKSYEGSISMYICAFLCIFAILSTLSIPVIYQLLISLICAMVACLSELYSKNGNDTIICPMSTLCALIITMWLGGYL